MTLQEAERLRTEWTDRKVTVAEGPPHLQRFAGFTGMVKTVNMSGRALVEFEGYNNNIGWFDIEIANLRPVDSDGVE